MILSRSGPVLPGLPHHPQQPINHIPAAYPQQYSWVLYHVHGQDQQVD